MTIKADADATLINCTLSGNRAFRGGGVNNHDDGNPAGTSIDCNDSTVPDECEFDRDGNGVADECDNCPDALNRTQTDTDGDAVFQPGCENAIPTVSGWGLAVLTLLVLTIGKVYFRHPKHGLVG